MSLENDIELIEQYNQWVIEKKRASNDITPTQFMIERAQAQALEKLMAIERLVQEFGDELVLDDIMGIINE